MAVQLIRRVVLSPFAAIYGLVTLLRNYSYDIGLLQSTPFDIPIVSVGNLSVGGTGKTPMVEYLINSLSKQYSLGVLSRGYGRKTNGFLWVNDDLTPDQVGDEPLQIKINHSKIPVAVCENRVKGIQQMLAEKPMINLILLDDAFQHRRVQAKVSLLLTTHQHPFVNDWLMPVGRLRESRNGYQRADALIVTKCPASIQKLPISDKPVFYAQSHYVNPAIQGSIYGFSGLANNQVFKAHLENNYTLSGFTSFNDHHAYSQEDVNLLEEKANGNPLVCTQKDWVKIRHLIYSTPVHIVQVSHQFVDEASFHPWLIKRIES